MNSADENFELREIQRLEGHTDRVWGVAWKPATGGNGVPAVLASCSGDKTVCIWEQSPATGSFQQKVSFFSSIFISSFCLPPDIEKCPQENTKFAVIT